MGDREDTDPHIDSDGRDEEEGFLTRWSRRKQAEGLPQGTAAPISASESARSLSAEEPGQPEPLRTLSDADMPPLESLDETSDYAPFMAPGISETLRKQALHRLFHLPGLHVPDGLDDYDEDFTRFASLGNVVTHEMKRALERELRTAEASQDRARTDSAQAPDREPDNGSLHATGATRDAPDQQEENEDKG